MRPDHSVQEACQGSGMFDLLYAAAVGELDTVQRCLERARRIGQLEQELSRCCGRGRCALHEAALGGHCSIVAALLKAGAPHQSFDTRRM